MTEKCGQIFIEERLSNEASIIIGGEAGSCFHVEMISQICSPGFAYLQPTCHL